MCRPPPCGPPAARPAGCRRRRPAGGSRLPAVRTEASQRRFSHKSKSKSTISGRIPKSVPGCLRSAESNSHEAASELVSGLNVG